MWTQYWPDFKQKKPTVLDGYYDLREDWALIESSFAAQYGIRLRLNPMSWNEFCVLLSGLLPETPLGRIVSIRAETDTKVIKSFNPEQKRIHREWQMRIAKAKANDKEALDKEMLTLSNTLREIFGKR